MTPAPYDTNAQCNCQGRLGHQYGCASIQPKVPASTQTDASRWEEFRAWFKRITEGHFNAATGVYDWNGLEDDFWEKLAQVAAEAREAALEEAVRSLSFAEPCCEFGDPAEVVRALKSPSKEPK